MSEDRRKENRKEGRDNKTFVPKIIMDKYRFIKLVFENIVPLLKSLPFTIIYSVPEEYVCVPSIS